MRPEFKPNVNLSKAFHSQMMLINDMEDGENGQLLIQAGTDGPPIHTHPEQEEHFTVIKGQLEVYQKDRWITVKAGEEIFTPKKMAHSYRSRHNEDCLFEYRLTPKRNFSGMMRTFERLSNENKLNSTSDLKSIIYLSVALKQYESESISVKPPQFVINIMAGIGKLLGFKI
jgi:mannose-6-phosphate isomerase-like protein (cupin superfamily)